MKTVQIREAKASLSRLVNDAESGAPTIITRNGKEVAMLVPMSKARRIYPENRPGFMEYLMSFPGMEPLDDNERPRMNPVDL